MSKVATIVVGALLCGGPVAAQDATKNPAPQSARVAEEKSPIKDNSFLIEEAYNQEPGVVQHISAFIVDRGTRAWTYAFTQEWPLFSQTHQLSYTLPIISAGRGSGSGIGDIALNYRYQLADGIRSGVAIAPRLSLLVPSGDERRERGAGGLGVQVNLPISIEHSARLFTHWNAGASLTPSAKNTIGEEATTRAYNLGASAIWLPLPVINFMLEVAWSRGERVIGQDERVGEEGLFLSPGVRGAIDFTSGLQIVPGFAVPIGIGPSRGDRMFFLYLSFEHPF
ncbi:MAG: transporter [Gemmatimonadaceae bacterium]